MRSQRRHAPYTGRQPLLARCRQKLAHEQRIAATQLRHRRAKRFLGTLVQLAADNLTNGRRAQRPKHQPLQPAATNHLREPRPLPTQIARAQPQQQQQRQIADPTRHVTEPRQRRIIGPLHIINRHDHRTTLTAIRAQPIQPMDGREPIRRRLPLVQPQRPCTDPCDTIKQPPPLLAGCRAQHRLKQLPRHPERDLHLKLRAARPQDSKPTRPRPCTHRRQQLGLPDPSDAFHHDDRPHPGGQLIKRAVHAGQRSVALQQPLHNNSRQDAHQRTPLAPNRDHTPPQTSTPTYAIHRKSISGRDRSPARHNNRTRVRTPSSLAKAGEIRRSRTRSSLPWASREPRALIDASPSIRQIRQTRRAARRLPGGVTRRHSMVM